MKKQQQKEVGCSGFQKLLLAIAVTLTFLFKSHLSANILNELLLPHHQSMGPEALPQEMSNSPTAIMGSQPDSSETVSYREEKLSLRASTKTVMIVGCILHI